MTPSMRSLVELPAAAVVLSRIELTSGRSFAPWLANVKRRYGSSVSGFRVYVAEDGSHAVAVADPGYRPPPPRPRGPRHIQLDLGLDG